MQLGDVAGGSLRLHPRRSTRLVICSFLSVVAMLVLTSGTPIASAATGSSQTSTPTNASPSSTPPYAATGYFSVTKKGNGYTLVTPQGDPFYASGIDTVAPDGSGVDQTTGVCPYCQTVANDYPSTAAWGTSTIAQLRSWGFNSLGPYSDDSDLGSQMPYEVQLSMASGDDWFASSFVANADQVAQTQVAPLANDPNVIGYFTDSELDWGPLLGTGAGTYESALQQYLQLPAGSPGLAVAQQYVGNPSGFLTALATRYFSVTTAAVHMYDTHHLILGVKAEGQEIEPNLIKAAAPYVNVFSIEDYVLLPAIAQGSSRLLARLPARGAEPGQPGGGVQYSPHDRRVPVFVVPEQLGRPRHEARDLQRGEHPAAARQPVRELHRAALRGHSGSRR